jgi:hypothetical protein
MNPDFAEILSERTAAGAEFIVVGAFAVAAHGNLARPATSTSGCGRHMTTQLVCFRRFAHSVHRCSDCRSTTSPDILAGIDGVGWEEAWQRRVIAKLGSAMVPVLSLFDPRHR